MTLLPQLELFQLFEEESAGAGQHLCLRSLARRHGFCSAPWSRLSRPSCLSRCSMLLVPQMVDQLVDVLQFFDTFLPVVAEQVVEAPKIILEDSISQRTALRKLQNCWWKCQQALCSSSRPLTFQYKVLVGVVENFKVLGQSSTAFGGADHSKISSQDRVQQPRLVKVFKVLSQDRVQQLLPQWIALQLLSLTLRRSRLMCFFGTSTRPKGAKVAAHPSATVLAHSSSSTLAALLEDTHVCDNIWVMIMSEEQAYYWNRLTRTSHWEMPPGRRSGWVRSIDSLFVQLETQELRMRPRLTVSVDRVRVGVTSSFLFRCPCDHAATSSCSPGAVSSWFLVPVNMQRQVHAVLRQDYSECVQIEFSGVGVVLQTQCTQSPRRNRGGLS